MGQAKQRGTREERVHQAEQNEEPEKFFGFKSERKPNETPFDMNVDDLVCMVSSITKMNLSEVQEDCGEHFQIGQWFCSTGAHNDTVVHGPFNTQEEAFDFAKTEAGAIRFMGEPRWEFG
jgi:hypothetical protein